MLLGALLAAGCGGTFDSTLTGRVFYNEQPLSTGTVIFQPVKEGPLALGSIQSDGSYTLGVGDESGLIAGDYLVTVAAPGPIPPATPQDPEPVPKSLIPLRYSQTATSGLTCKVEPGPNSYDIRLADKE